MLAIEVNGEFLDLAEAKVRLKLVSQVFARDFVAQGYSYPFNLPWTPTNARLLGHLDRIASVGSTAPVQGRLWLGGMPWRPCELVFRKFTGTAFDMDLRTPEDQLILDLKGRTLQDFTYGGPYDLTPAGFTLDDFDQVYHDHTGDIDATPFIFAPVRNTRRFGGRPEAYLNVDPDSPAYDLNLPDDYVNYYNAVNGYDWFYYDNDPDIQVFMHEFSPFFYLSYIAEEMVNELGYSLSSDVFEEEEVRRQVVVGNMHLGMMVVTQGGTTSSPDTDGYHSLDPAQALPKMSVYSFWLKLMKRYCAVFTIKDNEWRFKSMNSILDGTDVLDLTEYVVPSDLYEPTFADGYQLKSVSEPLEKGVGEYDPASITLSYSVDAFTDLAALGAAVGDYAYVSNENAIYQLNVGSGSNVWKLYAHNISTLTVDGAAIKQDVGVVISRMYQGQDAVTGARSWLLPWFDQGMSDTNADWHVLGDTKVSELRLLYYRGLQEDSEAETYPLLTNGTKDYAGDTIAGASHTERIDGAGGIHETWYARWLEVLQANRVAERKVRLPLHELLSFDFTRKVHIENINYLVRSIDVEVTSTGIGLATLELVKL